MWKLSIIEVCHSRKCGISENVKEYVISARNYSDTKSPIKPKTDPNGAISGTPLQQELRLKIGAKVMLVHNIDTADMLSNGQIGTLIDLIRTTENRVDTLVVKLVDIIL